MGYYGKVSGKSPEHVSGLVYSQEPTAQMVAQVAAPQENMRVLDLAAAPGGKSTHLLSYMNNTGVLVSNEISSKRSKVLVENIERFGARNVVVTNESSQKLSKVFKDYFDLIVLTDRVQVRECFVKTPRPRNIGMKTILRNVRCFKRNFRRSHENVSHWWNTCLFNMHLVTRRK